ncbi:hypothetical protein JCM10212_006512 [Sporobolomyces blumeae]
MHRSDTADSGIDELIGAYGDSPVKARQAPPVADPLSARAAAPDSPTNARRNPPPPRGESMKRTGTDQSTASTTSSFAAGFDSLPTLDRHAMPPTLNRSQGSTQTVSSSRRAANHERPAHPSRSKSGNSLDLIDRLDISGLYGGGGFVRHDGPYAAASSSRNQGTRAPIDAFDPSAFSLAPPERQSTRPTNRSAAANGAGPGGNSNISPRVAALAAMEHEAFGGPGGGGGFASNDGPYGAASRSGGGGYGERDGEVSMGFPSKKASGKGQQLIEIYGVRDNEAWEDFGSTRYEPGSSGQGSRESVVPPGVNKEDRMQRAQSIWDIEATLRAGKPVGQAPPPVPVLPSEWSQSSLSDSSPHRNGSSHLSPNPSSSSTGDGSGGAKPKRSKSLAARFRSGRKNPTNPILDEQNDADGRDHAVASAHMASSGSGSPAYGGSGGSRSQPTSPIEDRRNQYPPSPAVANGLTTTGSPVHVQGQAISTPTLRSTTADLSSAHYAPPPPQLDGPGSPTTAGTTTVQALSHGMGSIKFDEPTRPNGATRFAEQHEVGYAPGGGGDQGGGGEGLGRRPSGLKRLFSKKGKK